MGSKKKYYAVIRGCRPGIYTTWYGPGGAEEQVRGYAGALYKGFATAEEARRWQGSPEASTGKNTGSVKAAAVPVTPLAKPLVKSQVTPLVTAGSVIVYTDGGCAGNPGPGGYGAVILSGKNRKELAQGFRRTTNNRMELMGCIATLETLAAPAEVILHSDSRYVVNGISKGWARKWCANGWMRTKTEAAENVDLWVKLLELCDLHRVRFVWVHGHAGNRENERCDSLATGATQGTNLKEDHAYIRGRTRIPEYLRG